MENTKGWNEVAPHHLQAHDPVSGKKKNLSAGHQQSFNYTLGPVEVKYSLDNKEFSSQGTKLDRRDHTEKQATMMVS